MLNECSYDENKTRRQEIEIYYSFQNKHKARCILNHAPGSALSPIPNC